MSRPPRPWVISDSDLRGFIRTHGISLQDWANACGLSYRTVRAYYYGERSVHPKALMALMRLKPDRNLRKAADELAAVKPWQTERRQLRQRIAGLEVALRYAKTTRYRRGATGDEESELEQHRKAVAAMCRECEPDFQVCRISSCPLRAVSPLPLQAKAAA